MPILNREKYERWLEVAKVGNDVEKKDLTSRAILAVELMSKFIDDISSSCLTPHMRKRRKSLINKLWGKNGKT